MKLLPLTTLALILAGPAFAQTVPLSSLVGTTAGTVAAGNDSRITGALPTVATVAAGTAASMPATATLLATQGYTSIGDGGGATYKRVSAQPAHPLAFRSADRFLPNGTVDATNGGWWEYADNVINVLAAGANKLASPSAAPATTTAFVNATAAAKALGRPLHVPQGVYYVTRSAWSADFGLWLSGDGQDNTEIRSASASGLTTVGGTGGSLTPSTTYWWHVQALNGSGTVIGEYNPISIALGSNTAFTASWPPFAGAASYNVYVDLQYNGFNQYTNTAATSLTVSALPATSGVPTKIPSWTLNMNNLTSRFKISEISISGATVAESALYLPDAGSSSVTGEITSSRISQGFQDNFYDGLSRNNLKIDKSRIGGGTTAWQMWGSDITVNQSEVFGGYISGLNGNGTGVFGPYVNMTNSALYANGSNLTGKFTDSSFIGTAFDKAQKNNVNIVGNNNNWTASKLSYASQAADGTYDDAVIDGYNNRFINDEFEYWPYTGVPTRARYTFNLVESDSTLDVTGSNFRDAQTPSLAPWATAISNRPGRILGENNYSGQPYRVVGHSAVAASLTGTTAETALATIPLPAGGIGANGCYRITSVWSFTNSANNKNMRTRLGSVSGASYGLVAATTTAATRDQREICNRGVQNSQIGGTTSGTGGWSNSSSANATSAVDLSADSSITLSGTLALSTETITLESYTVEAMFAP